VTDGRDQLLDETTLRRALRLEADERAPVFDPAAIAAAARSRPRIALVSGLVALALSAIGAVAVWSAATLVLPMLAGPLLELVLDGVALVAIPVSSIADIVQQPAVPLSLLAALVIATAHELRQGRELAHAASS
jgi:hypothetical protein